jgi:hydrogenase nickel incorporation protein HypA/HybF
MHELGLAQGIFDIVRQHVGDSRAGLVRAVRVRVGSMAGVVPDSLQFCFEAIVGGTPYASASLVVDRVPAGCRCDACGHQFALDAPVFRCPVCRDARVRMTGGGELQVVDVELEDASRAAS